MFTKLKQRFKSNPTLYYAMSVAASWAGVGSLMNSITMTNTYGLVPSFIWSLGNSVACCLFGVLACKLEALRKIMRLKVTQFIIGFMSIFQLWINMNGIREIYTDTPIGQTGGTIIVYIVCISFIFLLLKFGMIRNVLTDSGSWVIVYALVALLTVAAFIFTGGNTNELSWGLEWPNMQVGITKGLLLLPGPFTFPYFYKLLDYNDQNDDNTQKGNIKMSFVLGGLMFGFYMIFTFALAFVQFSPALNLIKAILISIIGISTISTFIYSMYIVFGRVLGLIIDAFAVIFWPFVLPLGVMGVWTLMAEIRVYFVIALIVAAVLMTVVKKRRELA